MFDSPITKTFNLAKTYLYRTSAVLDNKILKGSSDETESTFAPDIQWSGVASAVTKNINLKTTQANKKNFTLSGAYAFTADGFFTLA